MERGEATAKFVGILAMALYEYGLTIHKEALQHLLQTRSLYNEPGGGIDKVVADASQYWAHKDPATHQAIAQAFLGLQHASCVETPQTLTTV